MAAAIQHGQRHRRLRLRVLEALDQRVKQFARREELWPLRIPHQPLLLADIAEQALGDEIGSFDPAPLRSRPLLHLEWGDGSDWDAWVLALPSGIKLYCDSSDGEDRILASGGRNEGDASDRAFLQLLAESAGECFGIEMSGGAPWNVRCSIPDRQFLAALFVDLFEVTGTEESVRQQLADRGADARPDPSGGDFQSDVERWLSVAATS